MPIRIPDALPATAALENENIFVMTEHRAMHQDIRPLRLLLLNLMPTKITTETQILRKLSNTPLQVEVELLQTASHDSKNTAAEHLEAFYTTFDAVRDEHFDGLIITGAPVERLEFEEVDYWPELCEIMEWSKTHVHSTLHICWGAQAGIYYHYGVPKHELPEKMFGVFPHEVVKRTSPLVRGFDDRFFAPHSRFTEVRAADIEAHPALELIAVSDEAGGVRGEVHRLAELLRVRSPRVRPRDAESGIRPRHRQGDEHRRAGPLLPRRRPDARAGFHVVLLRPVALHQLAELLCVPNDPLRHHPRWR